MEQVQAKRYDVFISYKRDDDAARDVLCDALERAGFEVWWDVKLGHGNFRHQLRHEINGCGVVIALWSQNAHARPDEVRMEMDHAYGVSKLLPLKLDGAPVPHQFAEENFLPFDGWRDAVRAAAQIERIIAEAERMGARPSRAPRRKITSAVPVDLGDLPAAPDKLIGREREMRLLCDAWRGRTTNAIVLHALGGAGKSALLRTFVNEQLAAGGDGAARIYGWSAYSQGSGDQKRADADGFLSKALADFGYSGPPIRDSIESGRTLAKLVQKERVLMLLDGVEPLQDPPGPLRGRFKDKGLAAFVKLLGAQNAGLLVITSRQDVPELEGFGSLTLQHPLEELSEDAGAELLVELGVRGRSRELKDAVREVDGHALSVTLLGAFLAEVCDGDIHERERFKFGDIILTPEELENADRTVRYAKKAEKILAGYLQRFEELARHPGGVGAPEQALLYLMGLFDRPADGPALDMLLEERIPGLTDQLFVESYETKGILGFGKRRALRSLTPAERAARLREAKARLRKLRLLSKATLHDPHALDAHPVVRAYFGGRLEKLAPGGAKLAHEKLYNHYATTALEYPETLEEMQTLFQAIQHGVKSGRSQDALDEIYCLRMLRGEQKYLTGQLGALGTMMATVSQFFEVCWSIPQKNLNPEAQAYVLAEVSYALGSLGWLRDSVAPREAALAAHLAEESWEAAGNVGEVLSANLLALGDVARAISVAEGALDSAERSGIVFRRECALSVLANAVADANQPTRALELFEAAEVLAEGEPLISLRGYQLGDLLLSLGRTEEAHQRGRYQLAAAQEGFRHGWGLHNIALAWLLLGRAQDALGDPEAARSLDAAVEGSRKSSIQDYLTSALLARAAHRRKRVAAGESDLLVALREDLAEIAEIAEPEMRLHLTELALERARLALEVPAAFEAPREAAARQTAIAAQLIAETGYHRRDAELAELRARLAES